MKGRHPGFFYSQASRELFTDGRAILSQPDAMRNVEEGRAQQLAIFGPRTGKGAEEIKKHFSNRLDPTVHR